MKRKQLGALLSKRRQHCDVGSAVTVLQSAVDTRVRPQKNKTGFLKWKHKNKNKSKGGFK